MLNRGQGAVEISGRRIAKWQCRQKHKRDREMGAILTPGRSVIKSTTISLY